MAIASLKTVKCTGPNAATETDVNNAPYFLSIDQASSDPGSYPIQSPLSYQDDPVRSYECWLRFELTSLPDSYIQNIKIYGPAVQPDFDRNPSNKLTVYWGTSLSGITPINTASTIATGIQHSQYNSVGTALTVPISTPNGRLDAIGEKTDYLVSQLRVDYGASQGGMNLQLWSLTYEEV